MTFEEAIFGVDRDAEVQRDEVCATCRETAPNLVTPKTCGMTCGGRGEVRQDAAGRYPDGGRPARTAAASHRAACYTCLWKWLERKKVKKTSIPLDNGSIDYRTRASDECADGIRPCQ